MKTFQFVLLYTSVFLTRTSFCKDIICENEDSDNRSTDWNELIFTQMWGYSECLQFKEHAKGGTCRNEDKPSIWSIHGIWPTEVGTRGPSCCTKVEFHKSEILSILDELNTYWYEINAKKDGTYFWTHEWVKHGSCAKSLDELGTQLKYFQKALELRNEFDLYEILKKGGIVPQAQRGYQLEEFSTVIEKSIGAKPYIQCLITKEDGGLVDHILAVELCLDKSFKPVDCETRKVTNHVELEGVAPCPDGHLIHYTDRYVSSTKEEL